MMTKQSNVVVHLKRPRTLTSAEAAMEALREELFSHDHKKVALECNIAASTVQRIASGTTRWPRPTTLFPILLSLGMEMQFVRRRVK